MSKATRQAFGEALARLGESHPEIVVLDADLAKSTKSEIFAKKFPNRFFEMGIAEANMIGTAAGLAFAGKMPFACSFGAFITGRYDTIRISAVYAQANVRLVGTHAGVGIGDDGHSQMGLEDISLMRALPTMGVFQPMDEKETHLIMDYLVNQWRGPAYIRLTRQGLPNLLPEGSEWEPGKLQEIKSQGPQPDVICIASGATVTEAVQAADTLAKSGLKMAVWNCHSLKPFDRERAVDLSKKCKLLVTVEDHSVIGGLGSCVAEAISTAPQHAPLVMLGVQDEFGQSGEPVELYDLYGISAKAIAESISAHIKTSR